MEKLALLGGEKAVKLDYNTIGNLPIVSKQSIEAVNELLGKKEISMSSAVTDFEKKFSAYIGTKYSIAMHNGTASLHTALFAAGVKKGDEIIVPSYTFWATVVPITSAQGTPVFVDVDPNTFCIDPKEIEKKSPQKQRPL